MGKTKLDQSNADDSVVEQVGYDERIKYVNKIAHPMATKKLTKRLYKCIKKSKKGQKNLISGIKFLTKSIKKGETSGFVVFAGDVEPLDIMSHLPIVCEDHEIPYCYVPSRMDLGAAASTSNGTVCIFVKATENNQELFKECQSEVKKMSYKTS